MELSKNAIRVLEARYLRRDAGRRIVESPEQLFESVAHGVSDAELLLTGSREAVRWREIFLKLLSSLDFLPNTPTLMNAGKPLGQLSACFVLPVEDSMEDIFESLKQAALVQRTGGGTGFSFSRLRPRGDIVMSTAGVASGPVSFMKIFDCATENIKQGGKRRGANMGVLKVDHPDIMDFVTSKADEAALRNFNISVSVTDAFMQAALKHENYPLIHPVSGKRVGTLNAGKVFEAIVQAAWHTGDPGLLFYDAVNRANPTPHLGPLEATNPCGEIPLLPYESCNLGSINLAHMVRDVNGRSEIDWQKLSDTAHIATRFLDDVIEVSRYPVEAIERMTKGNRKIGLGVMGFAEMLIRLGIPYDSDKAVRIAEQVMGAISQAAFKTSQQLADERGTFPNWKGSLYEKKGFLIRNATRTAVAPTGTIGIIAGTTPSIEPLFALAYRRSHVLEGQVLFETNPLFLKYLDINGLDPQNIMELILDKGVLQKIEGIPAHIRKVFVTALDIAPQWHLQTQQAFQKHVDNSVSKTVNLSKDAPVEGVANVYRTAWKMGLKGITIYRYGSKPAQVLEIGVQEDARYYDHGSKCDPEECRV